MFGLLFSPRTIYVSLVFMNNNIILVICTSHICDPSAIVFFMSARNLAPYMYSIERLGNQKIKSANFTLFLNLSGFVGSYVGRQIGG
jgi:hypothetical protein